MSIQLDQGGQDDHVEPDYSTEATDDSDELPAPEDVSPYQTTVQGLTGGPKQRKYAVRIRLPRDPQTRSDLPKDIGGVLAWVIGDICGESCIESLEILMFPGKYGLEFVLHARPFGLDGRSDTQSQLDSPEKQAYAVPLSTLIQSVKRRYPESILAEVGHLDLEPVGISDVTTTRLYAYEDGSRETAGNSKATPLKVLFDAFRTHHDPFMYQVIVNGEDGTYTACVRCATYRPKDNYTEDRGFAKLVELGNPSDLKRVFGDGNFTSNHDPQLAAGLWKTSYTKRITARDKFHVSYTDERTNQYTSRREVRALADRNRAVILGKREHRRLMAGDPSVEVFLKNDYNLFGRFPVFEAQLRPFVHTVTDRWPTNPWRDVEGRAAPVFNTVEEVVISEPAEFGYGEGRTDTATDETAVKNEGEPPHRSLEAVAKRVFTEGGDDIEKVDQTTDSLPDLRITTDDGFINTLQLTVDSAIVPVEAESTNKTKPSNTLKNAERAIAAGRHVIFVFKQENVELGYKHLSRGYDSITAEADGVVLYNGADSVRIVDGRSLVRRGSGKTTYELRGSELTVTDDVGELARGHANEDVSTFDWPVVGETTDEAGEPAGRCGYYREADDGTHRVETRDGTAIITYSEKKAFIADWCRIYEPHIPSEFGYLDHLTVTYRDEETNQIKVYDPTPEWATHERQETQKAGFATFLDQFIVARDGPELTYDALEETFATWFEGHSQYDAPIRSVIGGYLPEEFKDAKTGGTGNAYKYFDGYDWLFDPTIDSPHQTGPPADYDPDDPEATGEPDSDDAEEDDGDDTGEDNDGGAEGDNGVDDGAEDDSDDATEDDEDSGDGVEDDSDGIEEDDAEQDGSDDTKADGEDADSAEEAGDDSDGTAEGADSSTDAAGDTLNESDATETEADVDELNDAVEADVDDTNTTDSTPAVSSTTDAAVSAHDTSASTDPEDTANVQQTLTGATEERDAGEDTTPDEGDDAPSTDDA